MAKGLDLGIAGRTAIVCGASKGLGRACAESLADAGVSLVICARTENAIQAAAGEIAGRAGVAVQAVACDVTTETGRARLLADCPDPDILINNAGGPPPGRFEDWGETEWLAAINANMLSALMLIRAILPGMRARKWGRIVNITSAAVKAPLPMLGLSNGARAGLTGAVGALAREVARDGVTINALLPGQFETDRLAGYYAALSKARNQPLDQVRADVAAANPTGHIGDPADFGALCAVLCSAQARYINGQNLLMDGGAFAGLF